MPRFPQSGIELVAENSKYNRDINQSIANTARLDTEMQDVVQTSKQMDGMGGKIDFRIDTDLGDDTAIRRIEGLPSSTTVNIDARLGDDTGIRRVENIQDNQDVRVDVHEGDTSAISSVDAQLQALRALATINLVLLLPTNLLEISDALSSLPIISQLIEMENAVASVNARVIDEIPRAGQIINDIYVQNWGESRQQIADTLVLLDQFGVSNEELEDAATGAFQAAAISGEDMNSIIDAADKLVSNNLAPSYRDAFDFITRGFQEGFNSGEDFLDTLREYTPVFADNNLSLQGLFNILNTGMEEGVRNTDYLADAFKEMLNLTREEISVFDFVGDETDRTRALQQLGLGDEASAFAAGEISGDSFADGLIEALQKQAGDPAEQRRLALAIFNPTMIENVGLGPLLAMDIEQSSELETAWENAANEGADIMTATVGNAFSELSRTIEVEMTKAISSALNLDEWLDEAKRKVQRFADELQSGTAFGEALEIALQVPGLADILTRIESGFGNFEIVLLQVVASLADLVGQASVAASARAEVSRLGAEQLAFDLKLQDDGAGITSAVQTAIERGVDEAAIEEALSTAVTELIDEGDVAAAQAMLDNLELTPSFVIDPAQIDSDLDRALVARFQQGGMTDELQNLLHEQGLLVPIGIDTEYMQAEVNEAMAELGVAASEAIASGDFNTAADIAEQMGMSDATVNSLRQQAKEMGKGIKEGMDDAALATEEAGGRIYNELVGNSVVSDFMAVANAARTHFPAAASMMRMIEQQASISFPQAAYYVNSLVDAIQVGMGNALPILDATIEKLIQIGQVGTAAREVVQSVTAANAAMQSVTNNNTTVNVNQTNNVQNPAQAASVGMATSRQVRGLAA